MTIIQRSMDQFSVEMKKKKTSKIQPSDPCSVDEHFLFASAIGFAHYYSIGVPTQTLNEMYMRAMEKHKDALFLAANYQDKRDAAMVIRIPWAIGYLDAYHSLIGRNSVIHRLALLYATLIEVQPDYVYKFINHPQDKFSVFCQLIGLGLRLIWLTTVGAFLSCISLCYGGWHNYSYYCCRVWREWCTRR